MLLLLVLLQTPTAPKITRKNFARNFPKRALLEVETGEGTHSTGLRGQHVSITCEACLIRAATHVCVPGSSVAYACRAAVKNGRPSSNA
jgi:hypothetical protein